MGNKFHWPSLHYVLLLMHFLQTKCTASSGYDGELLVTNIADDVVLASLPAFPTRILFRNLIKFESSVYCTNPVNSAIHQKSKLKHLLIEHVSKYTIFECSTLVGQGPMEDVHLTLPPHIFPSK